MGLKIVRRLEKSN